MNKPQHTPGPWQIVADANHPSNLRISSNVVHVAKVYAESWLDVEGKARANAALIAAAPDLLAALQRWSTKCFVFEDVPSQTCMCNGCVTRRAIEKYLSAR